MILSADRDPRLITVRRGGTLTDDDHRLLAGWAERCAARVLPLFEQHVPGDHRPREALEHLRAWRSGEVRMMVCRAAGGHAMGAARPLRGAPRFAAYAAGQAACVAHVAEHDLGAAAYAIRAAVEDAAAAVPAGERAAVREQVRRRENAWQRSILPDAVRTLVLDDQQRRNPLCWSVFGV